ncbi:hypothetical protein [Kribbia dieselivorans]|uniref:hypothetical protein n=1 Tax=Kribbia dieselivorans TaxID=331526 RepID=UPI000839051B|nr:hypothetical protein [Kribbia dieselivorans]
MPSALAPPPVRVHLFTGPAVPIPAPPFVLDAIEEITVESGSGDSQSGFDLRLKVPKKSPLETFFLLASGANVPLLRVVIAVSLAGTTEVLMDGVMTHHEFSPGSDGGTLRVRGKDLTAVMDLVPLDGLPYPALPPAGRALVSLAKYAALGCVPLVIPSLLEDVPLPTDRIPRHQGTDYAYVKALAASVGHVFYIDPGPVPGVSKAYWGPEIRVGAAQPALNFGLDAAHDNVTSLSFSFDKESKEMPIVTIQEPFSKVPLTLPIPDVTPLTPPLGAVPPLPPKFTNLRDTAHLNPLAAVMTGIAHAAEHGDSVFAHGQLDVARYGRVLRSRQLVGVRGAGLVYNGLYYVTRVTHQIKRGSYTQSFTLARNALISTTPVVST